MSQFFSDANYSQIKKRLESKKKIKCLQQLLLIYEHIIIAQKQIENFEINNKTIYGATIQVALGYYFKNSQLKEKQEKKYILENKHLQESTRQLLEKIFKSRKVDEFECLTSNVDLKILSELINSYSLNKTVSQSSIKQELFQLSRIGQNQYDQILYNQLNFLVKHVVKSQNKKQKLKEGLIFLNNNIKPLYIQLILISQLNEDQQLLQRLLEEDYFDEILL